MDRAFRWLLATSILVLAAFAPRAAHACNDVEVYGRLVGVAKDGRFLYTTSSPVNGAGELVESFRIFGPDSELMLRAQRGEAGWTLDHEPDESVADLVPKENESLEAATRRAARKLGLRPLKASAVPMFASGPDETRSACLTFEAYARGSGTVVTEVESLYLACGGAASASLLHHDDSSFYFVRYLAGTKRRPEDNRVCAGYFDEYVWFPKGRIRSAALVSQAEKAAVPRREALYRDAVKADDTNARARLGLAAALSWGTSWRSATLFFDAWPKRTCLALAPDSAAERLTETSLRFADMSDFDQEAHDAWSEELVGALGCTDPP